MIILNHVIRLKYSHSDAVETSKKTSRYHLIKSLFTGLHLTKYKPLKSRCSSVCDPDFSHFLLQRCVQLTVGPTECVWVELAVVRRAGPAQAVTSVCATRSASNTEPARTGSASVTRAGTESTAPSVRASCVFACACAEVHVCCVSTRGCAQKHQHPGRIKWQLLFDSVKGI